MTARIFNPEDLFFLGEKGAYYSPGDISTLFQDAAGTTAVTADGDPVGLAVDKSGNAVNAAQSVSASRPVYNVSPSRLTYDKVDDALVITVPAGGWVGTMVLATDQGTASYGVSIPAGAYNLGGIYFPGNAIVGVVFRAGEMTAGEKTDTERYFVGNGAMASYGAVSSFYNFWRGHSEITEFPSIDTSSGENFSIAWLDCSSLTSFPLIDTSRGVNFDSTWASCSSLDSFPLINTSSGENFSYAWYGCSSLDSFPLIVTSKGTSFRVAWQGCSSLTSFPLINTSRGTNFNSAWFGCSSLDSFPSIDTSRGENFAYAWYGCSSLTSFPLIDTSRGVNFDSTWASCSSLDSFPLINTSRGTNFNSAWHACSSLDSFPSIDTSEGENFSYAWYGCTSLTSFPANAFDSIKGGDFTNAFIGTALSQTSINGILVSLVASGIAAGTRVFDQSGGSAPSSTGEAAIVTLRSRGWTVTVTVTGGD